MYCTKVTVHVIGAEDLIHLVDLVEVVAYPGATCKWHVEAPMIECSKLGTFYFLCICNSVLSYCMLNINIFCYIIYGW